MRTSQSKVRVRKVIRTSLGNFSVRQLSPKTIPEPFHRTLRAAFGTNGKQKRNGDDVGIVTVICSEIY